MRPALRASTLVVLVLSCVLVAGLRGQQRPTFRSGIDIVAIDVRVVDAGGRPVRDLRTDEFVVTVDGKPRTVVAADFVSYPMTAGTARAESRPAATSPPAVLSPASGSSDVTSAPGRTVVLVVDEENIRAGYGKWAGDAAGRFVDRLQPDDHVGLLIPRSKISIAPTTDHAAVKAGLTRVVGHMAHFQGKAPAEACDSVYGPLTPPPSLPGAQSTPPPFDGAAQAVVNDMRDRAINTFRSLAVLSDSLSTEPGPKTFVLISEELPVCDQSAAKAEFRLEYERVSEAAAKARATLYVMQLDQPIADAEDPQTSGANWRAQPSRDAGIRSLGLETVVSVTGGRRLLVSGIPDAPLARIALEISGYYLLGLRTEAGDRDGKPHPIKVTVRRKGVDVRARQLFTYAVVRGQTDQSYAPPDAVARPTAAVRPPPAALPSAPLSPPDTATPPPAPPAVPSRSPTVDVADLMSRVGSYIDDYAEKMVVVVGVEHYGQWLQREEATPTSVRAAGWQVLSRQTVAEFALVRNARDWDGYRNVYDVDGKSVPDAKDRFQKLFAERPANAIEQSRKIAAESARYNMGALQRNFNVPTIALFFLTRANQGRFRFTKDKDDELGGVPVCKVKFEETHKPTIIKTSAGKDMPVKGEAWIDCLDGRVLKTHIQIDSETTLQADMNTAKAMQPWQEREGGATRKVKTTASITVTYTTDSRLGLLVPSEMLETYEAPMRNPLSGEDEMTKINCRATYSDFKRFETSGRLMAPK